MMNRIGVADTAAPLLAGGYGTGASPRRFAGTTLADWLRARERADARAVRLDEGSRGDPADRPLAKRRLLVLAGRPVRDEQVLRRLAAGVGQRVQRPRHVRRATAGSSGRCCCRTARIAEPDSVPAESDGEGFTFPHTLPADGFDAASLVRTTPFIDDLVVVVRARRRQLAQAGDGPGTDLLAVSLSATDVIGHRFGPDSREMHDQVLRVDRAIGTLLDSLYKLRDSSTITIALIGRPRRGHDPRDRTGERAAAPSARVVRQAAERDPRRA